MGGSVCQSRTKVCVKLVILCRVKVEAVFWAGMEGEVDCGCVGGCFVFGVEGVDEDDCEVDFFDVFVEGVCLVAEVFGAECCVGVAASEGVSDFFPVGVWAFCVCGGCDSVGGGGDGSSRVLCFFGGECVAHEVCACGECGLVLCE